MADLLTGGGGGVGLVILGVACGICAVACFVAAAGGRITGGETAWRTWIEGANGTALTRKVEELHAYVTDEVVGADGRRAFAVRQGDAWYVVIGDDLRGPYRRVPSELIQFSPDGRRLCFCALETDGHYVVVDDAKYGPYDRLNAAPRWRPDGSEVAWSPQQAAKWSVVIEGKTVAEGCERILEGTPVFGPRPSQAAWGMKLEGKWYIVANGAKYGPYENMLIEHPRFSADGERVAWGAKEGGRWSAFVNGQARGTFDGTSATAGAIGALLS